MFRQIDAIDLKAIAAVRNGTQPRHCGLPARYEGDGVWECEKLDAVSTGTDDRGRQIWKKVIG